MVLWAFATAREASALGAACRSALLRTASASPSSQAVANALWALAKTHAAVPPERSIY